MTELANEDRFRLHVLLANQPQAIRIDESRMIVYGLAVDGEAKIVLNPIGPPERYLRAVRELLSGQILGSPGGYPVYLQRWTRMGQMRDRSLEPLLLLGEPEAVVAAACAPGLTDELARRAWWAMENAENARRMLCNPAIAGGRMGPTLAGFLLEFLPFETDTEKISESVRWLLQPGLIAANQIQELWHKAARRPAYLLGFLQALPEALPEPPGEHPRAARLRAALADLHAQGNPGARLLYRVRSAAGQAYLQTLARILAKPPTQDVVQGAFDAARAYFAPLRPEGDPDLPLPALLAEAEGFCSSSPIPPSACACQLALPELGPDLAAMRVLSGLGYGALRPVLRDTTAIGSLMRRKLQPVLEPVLKQIRQLQGG